MRRVLFLIMITLLLGGCCNHQPAPHLRQDWDKRSVPDTALADARQANLSVLIMYSGRSCAHSALRLYSPEIGTVFWDPAGGYGIESSIAAWRTHDLVVEPVPTLVDYLQFRTEIPTDASEIFEWDISAKQAARLYAILKRSNRDNPEHEFDTRGVGLFCGAAVSEFLHRFAGDIMTVEEVFYPHDLALQLYRQLPRRVLLAVPGKKVVQYQEERLCTRSLQWYLSRLSLLQEYSSSK